MFFLHFSVNSATRWIPWLHCLKRCPLVRSWAFTEDHIASAVNTSFGTAFSTLVMTKFMTTANLQLHKGIPISDQLLQNWHSFFLSVCHDSLACLFLFKWLHATRNWSQFGNWLKTAKTKNLKTSKVPVILQVFNSLLVIDYLLFFLLHVTFSFTIFSLFYSF